MSDCAHVFAPCDGECTSPTQRRAAEINARQRAAMRRYNALYFVAVTGLFIVFLTGVLVAGVSIAKAGAENISNTISANQEP